MKEVAFKPLMSKFLPLSKDLFLVPFILKITELVTRTTFKFIMLLMLLFLVKALVSLSLIGFS